MPKSVLQVFKKWKVYKGSKSTKFVLSADKEKLISESKSKHQ
jgi:hypothetical protein